MHKGVRLIIKTKSINTKEVLNQAKELQIRYENLLKQSAELINKLERNPQYENNRNSIERNKRID